MEPEQEIVTANTILEELKKPWSARELTTAQIQARKDFVQGKGPDYTKWGMSYGPNYTKWALERELFQGRFRSQDQARRDVLHRTIQRQFKQAENDTAGLSTRAREAFQRYQLQHEMYTPWDSSGGYSLYQILYESTPWDDGSRDIWAMKKSIATVSPRGDLINDLPMLSLVNREIFRETFHFIYSSAQEGLRIRCVVRHLDFFPFLRFYQLLTKTLYPHKHDPSKPHKGGLDSKEIGPSKLYILFDLREDERDGVLHATKFSQVKRLIELHWVDGLPIWGCLTGLGDCYGDDEGPFTDWMYSVRQIVA
jgi:hypothetical protein